MVYKIILEDGDHIGHYSDKKCPSEVAKAAMRVIYNKTDGDKKDGDINFFNTITKREYTYRTEIEELEEPQTIIIAGNKKFSKKYIIKTKRI